MKKAVKTVKTLKRQEQSKYKNPLLKAGRPKTTAKLDDKTFDKVFELAKRQFTRAEIYSILNISQTELQKKVKLKEQFETAYLQGVDAGKGCVKYAQFEMAQSNPVMSIFWGKQHLGQSDNPNQLINADLGTLKVEFVDGANESQEDRIKEIEKNLDEELK